MSFDGIACNGREDPLVSLDRMMVGIADWTGTSAAAYATGEASGGLDRTGLIVIIIVSIIAVVAFVWIFRETGRRD
jgi:hypothetical protein